MCFGFFYFLFCIFYVDLCCTLLGVPGWVIIKIRPPGTRIFLEKKILREKKTVKISAALVLPSCMRVKCFQ